MGWLLLRTFGTLAAFQVVALVVVLAGRRDRSTVAAIALVVGLGLIGLGLHRMDPVATWAAAAVAAWLVERGLRRGAGLGSLSVAGTAPVLAATLLTLGGRDPAAAWSNLRAQVETVAGVQATSPDSLPAVTPEDRARAERVHDLARTAARWAMRLVPVEMVVFAWLQVLCVIAVARRAAVTSGRSVRLPPPSRWQVPFAWIWVLAGGLALVAVRQTAAATAGWNLAGLAASVLAIQGVAVVCAAVERSPSPLARAMLLSALALVAWPLFAGGLALVGAADLWVDFRRLRRGPDES